MQASLGNVRAEIRGLAKSQLLLKQAETASADFEMPEDIDVRAVRREDAALEKAKTQAEQASARHEVLQQHVQRIQAEKKQLESHIEHIKHARLAAESFDATMGQLELSLLEIRLRVEDETLAPDKLSALLQAGELEAQQQILAQQRETLTELSLSAPIKLKLVLARLEEVERQELEAEVQKVSAEKLYSEELKRQELLQAYSGQTPQALSAKLPDLQEELAGLNGTLQLAHHDFTRRQTEVTQLQQQLDAISPPEAAEQIQLGVVVRADEVEHKTEQVKGVIAYYDQRIEQTQALHSALTGLIEDGNVYRGDATVLNGHVFSLQVPVGLLEQAIAESRAQADAIPEGMRSEELAVVKAKVEMAAEEALSAIEQAKEQLGETTSQLEKTQAAREEAEAYLEQLQQQAEAAEKARRWASELKNLTAEQVVERFQETAQRLSANDQALQDKRKAFESAKEQADEEHLHYESLTDPLLRSAQREAATEEHHIIKKLYAFAEIEPPAELKAAELTEVAKQDVEGEPDDSEQYQNLLATRERIIQERETQQTKLKGALGDFKHKIEDYEKLLSESDILLQQHYANAIELKKRIGRGRLTEEAIPEGITAALDVKRIETLEANMADLIHQAAEVQQRIDSLSQPGENLKQIRTALEETIGSVGKRLDVARDLEKLQQDIQRTAADRSKVEAASLAQTAARRQEAGDSREEWLWAFVPSEGADEVTDLLKIYYQELIELESKRANLQEQHALTKRMIELAEAEKTAVADLLPLFRKQEALLRVAEEEA